MTLGLEPDTGVQAGAAVTGALPDAPLAMPKQRLERASPFGHGVRAALIRPFFARTGRSEG